MENKDNKGKFIHGFLMGAAGWIISSLIFALIQFIAGATLGMGDFFGMTMSMGIVWLPLALIGGNISRKKGLKSAIWFTAASFFIFAAVVGGCMTMLSGLG